MSKPVAPADADAETAAYREAVAAFVEIFAKRIGQRAITGLAGTDHQHSTLIIDHPSRTSVIVRFKISFSDVIDPEQLAELIEQASRTPGSVPEA